ncbi:MAG: hypothetical protein HDT30_04110 [Clostridiales bacterium]|nr:hypothetical protein [Clostridiales bacterium]
MAIKYKKVMLNRVGIIMKLIQVGLYPDTKQKGIWGEWRRKYLRYRDKWINNKKSGYGSEWREIILPANESEGKRLGTKWFWKEIKRIQELNPEAIYYYTPEVCRIFELAEYRKQWISWYFLFPQIWEELERIFQLEGEKKDMIVCDTKDDKAKFLTSKLIDRAGRIEICTRNPEKWEQFSKQCYEDFGLVLEFSEEMPKLAKIEEEKIIWDLEGKFYKNYPIWEKSNIIIALGIKEENIEYLRYRLALGKVIYGYEETLQGQKISHKFSSLLMQSINWRICQLGRSESIYFDDKEMWGITLYYQWKLETIKRLTMSPE